MSQTQSNNESRDHRVPFRVPLNPDQLVEICRRRNQRTDGRTLAQWVECGLSLALAESAGEFATPRSTAAHDREIELFCMVAEVAPSALRGAWRALYAFVWDRREFWVFPSSGHWQDDEPAAMSTEPYLDREALAQHWVELLAGVHEGRGVCLSGV